MPNVKVIGGLHTSSDDSSTAEFKEFKQLAEKEGVKVKDYTITSTNDIDQVSSTMASEVEAVYIPTDNTVASGFSTVVKNTDAKKIPVFPSVTTMIKQGGIATVSVSQYELGKLTGQTFSPVHLALPLGVSFYLFQSAGYLIDVYRGARAERNPVDFSAFVLAFPQLTMGPILRYDEWRGALKERTVARGDVLLGFECFAVGLCFKVLLADQLAPLWASLERIGYGYLSTPLAWLGAASYSLQLYFDFSGYSLMAMGLGQMLGLRVPRNFDLPYTARSVSEFYRRWHITLGTWFRDYLYIPLGGSRRGKARTALALTVVWVFTGLWHGASWNFVLWGVMLLAFILLEKFCIGGFLREHRLLSHLYLLFVIPQTWVVFRITKLSDIGAYFSRLFPFFGTHSSVSAQDALKLLSSCWWLLLLSVLFCLPQPRRFYEKHRGTLLIDLPLFVLFWVCVYFIATSSGNAFLYSRF